MQEISLRCWHWFSLGALLMICEFVIPSFIPLWIGLAAIVVGACMQVFPGLSLQWQLFLWAMICVFYLIFWFKLLSVSNTKISLNELSREAIEGQEAVVTQSNYYAKQSGTIRLLIPIAETYEYPFTSQTEIEVGAMVTVIDIEGGTLIVSPNDLSGDLHKNGGDWF